MRNKAKGSNLHILEVVYVIESDGAQNRLHENLQRSEKSKKESESRNLKKKEQ